MALWLHGSVWIGIPYPRYAFRNFSQRGHDHHIIQADYIQPMRPESTNLFYKTSRMSVRVAMANLISMPSHKL